MTRDEVLAFVKANPVAFMATVERGKPRVRAMQTALVEPAGLVFCTGVQKDVHRQLVADRSVELAYWDAKNDVQHAPSRRGDEGDHRRGIHVPEAHRRAIRARDLHLVPACEGDIDRLAHGTEQRTAGDRGVLGAEQAQWAAWLWAR
jgi:hypothetical protein